MADLIKMKTGTIAKLEQKKSDGSLVVPVEKGTVYFAVDAAANGGKGIGQIVFDNANNQRIVMSTLAEKADEANYATSAGSADSAGTAEYLLNGNTIDGITFTGQSAISHYGICSTAAGTSAKTVSCTGYKLVTGSRITVTFLNTNTAANPTLEVNTTGAKAI